MRGIVLFIVVSKFVLLESLHLISPWLINVIYGYICGHTNITNVDIAEKSKVMYVPLSILSKISLMFNYAKTRLLSLLVY